MTKSIERHVPAVAALMAETIANQKKNDQQNGTVPGRPSQSAPRPSVSGSTSTSATQAPAGSLVTDSQVPSGAGTNGARNMTPAGTAAVRHMPTPAVTLDAPNISAALDTLPKNEMDFAAVLLTMRDLAQSQRNWDRMQRNTGFTNQIQALQSSANEIRDSAKLTFGANIAQSALQIGSGAAQIGTSAGALRMTKSQISTNRAAENLATKVTGNDAFKNASAKTLADLQDTAATAGAKASHLNNVSMGMGSAAPGLGGLAAAPMQYASAMADARRTDDETTAKLGEMMVSQSNDSMQTHSETIRDAKDSLKNIQSTQVETMKNIIGNIA